MTLRFEYRTHAPGTAAAASGIADRALRVLRTESLTLVAETHAPDEDFAALKAHYNDAQITEATIAIAHMNALNRIAIGAGQAAPA